MANSIPRKALASRKEHPVMNGNTLSPGEVANFHAAVIQALPWDIDPDIARNWTKGGDVLTAQLRKALFPPPPPVVIRVDRSIRPAYPDWMKEVLHPELEVTGPVEFNLATLDAYLYGEQKNRGVETGNQIYKHLKSEKLLDSCLNLQDALAIQAMGIEVFRKRFKGKAVFFWKSVVRNRNGNLRVPHLGEYDGRVKLSWYSLGYDWDGRNPALRFVSETLVFMT